MEKIGRRPVAADRVNRVKAGDQASIWLYANPPTARCLGFPSVGRAKDSGLAGAVVSHMEGMPAMKPVF